MTLQQVGTRKMETERLVLRPFQVQDAQQMFENWASDEEVTRFLTWPTHESVQVTKQVLESWVSSYSNRDYYQWAIVLKKTGQVIGSLSLMNVNDETASAEAGYCIGRAYWNQGIVTEAFKAMISFGFERIGLDQLEAYHDVKNPASGRVMKKCGLQPCGQCLRPNPKGENGVVWCEKYIIQSPR